MYTTVVLLPTDAACCPDINIEDVVLLNKIGEIAENTAIYTQFSGLGFKVFMFSGFRV
jgi:hypothetical protein